MWGVFLKDIIQLKKNWIKPKFILTFFLILVILIPLLKESSILIAIFIAMFLINSVQSLFINDIKSGWLQFLNTTTEISVQRIVLGRFLSSISVCLIANIIFYVVNIIIYIFYKPLAMESYLLLGGIFLSVSLIYIFALIPFTYLFDHNGLTVIIIFFIFIGFSISKFNNVNIFILTVIDDYNNFQLAMFAITGLILISLLSFYFSYFIYKKRYLNQ